MNEEPKPTVVHFVECFLERSETFIYNIISAHRDWTPIVLTTVRRNEDEFRADDVRVLPRPITKRDPVWWLDQIAEKLTGCSSWHRRVQRVLGATTPAVIHAHFGQQGVALLPVTRRAGLPLVTTFYGYDMSVLPRKPAWRRRFRELFRDGDLFLVEGAHMQARLLELGAPAGKVRIQRIGIYPKRYPAWKPVTEPRLLFVGRFLEKKGLVYALEAFAAVRTQLPGLKFRIVGDGEERRQMEHYVSLHGLSGDVKFLGMLSHSDVLRELSQARALIHPSVRAVNGDSEGGAPTILLEAQAVGIPIVTTTHADIPHIVDPQENGIFLSPERDAEHLSSQLRVALDSAGPEGHFVREHHDVEKEVIVLETMYRTLARRDGLADAPPVRRLFESR